MFVFSNLATSIDGKIATASREHFPLGTPADRRLMQKLRARSDAIIIGAGTLRAYRRPLLVTGASRQPLNVLLSSTLDGVSPRWPFFTDSKTRKILFVSPFASQTRLRRFAAAMGETGEILQLRKTSGVASQIIRGLGRRGARRLLVEGGGGVMWDFIQPHLLDEIHLTLTPRIVGGVNSPTLVEGVGFSAKQVVNLRLRSCRRLGDELYLVYSRKN